MWGVIVVAKTRKAVAVDVPAPAPTGGSVSVPAGSRVHHVAAAEGDAFSPQRLTVAAGDTVVWTNRDSRLHTVTADGGLFDSGSLAPSGRFSHTFRRIGTLVYYCRLHGSPGEGMWGVVVVTKAAGGGGGGGGGGATGGARGGGGGSEPSPTLVVTRAEYDPDDHELRIEAESSSAALVVRAYVAATGNLIARLANEGGGDYRSEFTWPSNPRRIRIESNLGGSATSGVEVK
jgi:plastocyanin